MLIEKSKKITDIPEAYRPTIEELPGDLARIAGEIELYWPGMGVDLTLFMAQVFRGQPVYFRNIDGLIRRIRDDAIRAEYDQGGVTMVQMASKWNLSHQRIKEILAAPGGKRESNKQMRLF